MSTTDRPYRLTIENADARAMAEAGELEGSTFAPVTPRSFSTISAARARARNLLTEQYDPRVPFEKQPHAVISGPEHEVYVHLPYGEIKLFGEISDTDLMLSDARITTADVMRKRDELNAGDAREALRGALGLWISFEMMAGLR